MPRATDRYVCVVTRDLRIQLLDPEHLDRRFVTIDFGDWKHYLHNGSVLLLRRKKETLLWHIDRCVGVRCDVNAFEIDAVQDSHGAAIITVKEEAVRATYLVPFPDMADDEVDGCPYPNPAVDAVPMVSARLLHRSSVALGAARRPFSFGEFNTPPYFVDSEETLWRLSPEARTEQ